MTKELPAVMTPGDGMVWVLWLRSLDTCPPLDLALVPAWNVVVVDRSAGTVRLARYLAPPAPDTAEWVSECRARGPYARVSAMAPFRPSPLLVKVTGPIPAFPVADARS